MIMNGQNQEIMFWEMAGSFGKLEIGHRIDTGKS